MATAVNPNPTQEFDVQAFLAKRNAPPAPPEEVEAKPKEEAKPEVKAEEPPKVEEAKVEPPKPHASRRERWLLKQLGKQEALTEQLNARLAELEAKSKGGDPATEPEAVKTDPEPQRADFASEAEFVRALGGWVARHETKQTLEAENKKQAELRSQESYLKHVQLMDAKEKEDIALFDDWEEVKKAGLANKETLLRVTPALTECLELSDKRAAVLHYFCTHPEAVKRFDALAEFDDKDKQTPQSRANQIQEFLRLEGRVESYVEKYMEKKAKAEKKEDPKPPAAEVKKEEPPKPKAPTAEERDAKKAVPTAAISPKAGGIADDTPKMFLDDGATLNPKWSAWRNAQRQR